MDRLLSLSDSLCPSRVKLALPVVMVWRMRRNDEGLRTVCGDGEVARWLRALDVPPGGPVSIPSALIGDSQRSVTPVPGKSNALS